MAVKHESIEKWVDLSQLPKLPSGNVEWKNTVGRQVPFKYDKVEGVINIVSSRSIGQGQYKIGILIDKYVTEPYEIVGWSLQNCYLQKLVYKRIFDYAPQLIQYLDDPMDAYRYSYGSNKPINAHCPVCGNQEVTTPNKLFCYGFVCHACSSNISFPNRLMYQVLKDLKINFTNEACRRDGFSWMRGYRYDFYLRTKNVDLLIEMDGGLHSYKEQRIADDEKTRLALHNGFRLIRIDCVYGKYDAFQYIKQHIIDSELSKFIPICNVNWEKCYQLAITNLVKDACMLWETDKLSIQEIALSIGIAPATVSKYLQRGVDLGLCPSYNYTESQRRGKLIHSKAVALLDNGVIKYVFITAREVEEKSIALFGVKLRASKIYEVCSGNIECYCGLFFKYITKDEYETHQHLNNQICDLSYMAGVNGCWQPIAIIDNQKIQYVFKGATECEELSEGLFGRKYNRDSIGRVINGHKKTYMGKQFIKITKEEYIQYKMINNEVVLRKGDEHKKC